MTDAGPEGKDVASLLRRGKDLYLGREGEQVVGEVLADLHRIGVHLEDLVAVPFAADVCRPLDAVAGGAVIGEQGDLRVEVLKLGVAVAESLAHGQLAVLVEGDRNRLVGGVGNVHDLHRTVLEYRSEEHTSEL